MKRFLETAFAIKVNSCLCFTGLMFLCLMVEVLWKVPLLTVGWTLQILVISMISGCLQFVFYSGAVVRRLSAFWRTICFLLLLLGAILTFAVVFEWFPLGEWTAWAIFLGLFGAGFLGIGGAFELMFRITGRRYTDLLNQAQKET